MKQNVLAQDVVQHMRTEGCPFTRQSVCQEMGLLITLPTSQHTHEPHVYNIKYCWQYITKLQM